MVPASVPKQSKSLINDANMKDQRRWQRLPLGIPIIIQGITEQKTPLTEFATTTNIGAGGVLLATRVPLLVGRRISLQIPAGFPEQQPPLRTQRRFRARVLRVVRQDHWYLCAAAFSTPLLTGTPPQVSGSAQPGTSDST
jgi:hypothetical protein